MFAGKRALISFLSWLDYCDQLIKEAQKVLTTFSPKKSFSLCVFLTVRFVFLHRPPVRSCCDGASREGALLRFCDGAAAHADVSRAPDRPSIVPR